MLLIVLGLAAIACIAFVVWWGGGIRARRRPDGTIEVHATGRQPPGRVEVGKEATVDRVGKVDMSAVDAPPGAAERTAAGGASVGEKAKFSNSDEVVLAGVRVREKSDRTTD